MTGRALLRALLLASAVGLCAMLVFVGLSVTGRGTRAAVGEARTADAEGVRIAYHDLGAGQPVVLLASWARPASDFNELALALEHAGFRTLAIESRGIGGSQGGGPLAKPTLDDLAADVAAVLRAAGVPEGQAVHVVGHAFGNRVARSFAARHPERTHSVTLVAAGGRAPVPERLTRALIYSSASFLPWSLREPALRAAFFAAASEIPEHWKTGWCLWGGLAQAHAAATGRSEAFWGAGGAPLLVFQASEDSVAPAEAAGRALRDEFPERVTLVPVAHAGHALLPERPAQIERALLAFLGAFGEPATAVHLSRD